MNQKNHNEHYVTFHKLSTVLINITSGLNNSINDGSMQVEFLQLFFLLLRKSRKKFFVQVLLFVHHYFSKFILNNNRRLQTRESIFR